MALDGCGSLCKCILILINIVFGLLGAAMLGLGLWLRFSSSTRGFFDIDLNTQQFVFGVTVLIILGALMLVIAAFGDCGACNENRTALGVFSVLLAILAAVEIGAGVLAYINSDQAGKNLAEFYSSIYLQYVSKGGDPSMAITLQLFHNVFDCCGMGGALEPLVRETCPETGFFEAFTVSSCLKTIPDVFRSKAPMVLGGFVGTAAVMFFGLICGCILSNAISQSRSSLPQYFLLSHSTVSQAPPLSNGVPNYALYPSQGVPLENVS